MATASAGHAAKGSSQAPARSARPCSAAASRSAGQGRGEDRPKTIEPSSCARTRGADMTGHDPEIEILRDKVHCAVVLERCRGAWIAKKAPSAA